MFAKKIGNVFFYGQKTLHTLKKRILTFANAQCMWVKVFIDLITAIFYQTFMLSIIQIPFEQNFTQSLNNLLDYYQSDTNLKMLSSDIWEVHNNKTLIS